MSESAGGTSHLTIVHTGYGMALTTIPFADWRAVQEFFGGYKASLGPWEVGHVVEYLAIEYPTRPPFEEELVRQVASSTDALVWADELTNEECCEPRRDLRVVGAAASDILDRPDDVYDQRPDALSRLIAMIDQHMSSIDESALGRVAAAAKCRLLDLRAVALAEVVRNRHALAATDELRRLCAST